MNTDLKIIGHVRTSLTDKDACPKQYTENAPEGVIEILPEFAEAADTLHVGRDILIFTWLHAADRDTMKVHPRGNTDVPKKGVFNTRSPDRPNPIGLHKARILALDKNDDGVTLRIDAIEVLDGTPVVDIKSTGPEQGDGGNWGSYVSPALGSEFQDVCRRAWEKDMLPGLSGNASVRLGDVMVITRSGTAKGKIMAGTLTAVDVSTGAPLGPGNMSSEGAMHMAVYAQVPEAKAVLHTHPPYLLAHDIKTKGKAIDLPLFEAEVFLEQMKRVPDHAPGTKELAEAVGEAAETHNAVFMENHGLMCWGKDLNEALALSEALDALARTALMTY